MEGLVVIIHNCREMLLEPPARQPTKRSCSLPFYAMLPFQSFLVSLAAGLPTLLCTGREKKSV